MRLKCKPGLPRRGGGLCDENEEIWSDKASTMKRKNDFVSFQILLHSSLRLSPKKKAREKKSKLKGMKNFWNVSMAKASLMKQHFSPAIRNFRSCNFQKLTHRAVIINYSWGTLCATIFRMRNEKGRICESWGVYRMKPRERDKLWMAKCFYGLMKFSFCDELCYVKLFL